MLNRSATHASGIVVFERNSQANWEPRAVDVPASRSTE